MKRPDIAITVVKSIGILLSVVFLFIVGFQIAEYTNHAPDVSALSSVTNFGQQTPTPTVTLSSEPDSQ